MRRQPFKENFFKSKTSIHKLIQRYQPNGEGTTLGTSRSASGVFTVSPLVITALIIAGIVVLFVIGYINHMVENSKLEKARLKADLNDRVRRSRDVSENMPGQLMSPALKVLLSRFELHYGERLLALDKQNINLMGRLTELRDLIAATRQHMAVDRVPAGVDHAVGKPFEDRRAFVEQCL